MIEIELKFVYNKRKKGKVIMKFLGTNSTLILDNIKDIDCEFNYRGGCLFIRIDGKEYKTSTIKKIDINNNKIEFHSKNSVYIFSKA